jgi:hypothetical protein
MRQSTRVVREPLESAKLKIGRAEDHLNAFNRCHERFRDADPYRVTRQLHADGAKHVYTVEIRVDPPAYLSAIAGDFFHNLRSALDSIVYDLSLAAEPSLSAKERRTIGYPIAKDEGNLDPAQMRYAPCAAQAEIKATQPYQGGNAEMHPLWLLHDFNKIDKHREVVVVPANAMGAIMEGGPLPDLVSEWFRPIGPFENGAVLACFTFSTPHPEVDVDFSPMLNVSLGERVLPASFDMEEMLACVRDSVLPRFERFF